jgi:hypothetical protein
MKMLMLQVGFVGGLVSPLGRENAKLVCDMCNNVVDVVLTNTELITPFGADKTIYEKFENKCKERANSPRM